MLKAAAVIPARGGSKGVPRKNAREICGHPLIAWSIADALRAELIYRTIVSTEDEEIAFIARRYGAEVIKRPLELAEDHVPTREVLSHALESLSPPPPVLVLLQPTSPVRRPGLVDRSIAAFLDGGFDSLATGQMVLQYPPHGVEHRRQDVKEVFVNDGSVVVMRAANLSSSLFGSKAGTMVTSREENVDIDEPFDFWL
ncbi:MAG: acylneuraminate cytidylyltransferase family protein, partial [Deltaproteobacteria bacterium]|nr:acylneuraminate cytidylyltransferase family protein [Deltaproteobacteria bacterium]